MPSPAPRGRLSRRESDIGKSATALPEGVAEIWIGSSISDRMESRPGRAFRFVAHDASSDVCDPPGVESSLWIAFPAVWLRHRRLPSVTASRSVP